MQDHRSHKNNITHHPLHRHNPPTQDEEQEAQDDGNDQGGAHEEQDKEDEYEGPQVPHP
jgi:hypothetical protein